MTENMWQAFTLVLLNRVSIDERLPECVGGEERAGATTERTAILIRSARSVANPEAAGTNAD
ncbi:hypothetical protein [Polluticaenibacter yanchengensis]|uniref:Uncharacterized protein n=1 Tax=Polluticaenibacter yanchengensis TaxID=3014562 RepID=A0ABT4UHE6_9BACT|nr:hypothetical protein [Chitinophagaceae bacterium LY-5]